MKKTFIVIMCLVPFFALAQKDAFTIKGKIENAVPDSKIYLSFRLDGSFIKDSSSVKDGAFSFKGTAKEPIAAKLTLIHGGIFEKGQRPDDFTIYLENGNINVTARDSVKNAIVTGSGINFEYQKYQQFIAEPEKQIKALNNEWLASTIEQKQDENFRKGFQERYKPLGEAKQKLQEMYILKNPNSYFSLISLKELFESTNDISNIEQSFKNLSLGIKSSKEGMAFSKRIETARKTAIGAMAMNFTQNDTLGNPVSLSDFKGKYVLLDFWASWCGPCRAENPNVVAAFKKYKDKNFTVLGVSLDQPGKKDAWLSAIHHDNLTWTQVSDLKFWDNEVAKQYGIRAIPQNFLIDPSGKIIAKNIRGEELNKKLQEVLE